MIKTIISSLLIIFALQSCASSEKDVCKPYGEVLFHEALSIKLDEIRFPYSKDERGLICVKEPKATELRNIVDQVHNYYRGLATILTTQNQQDRVLSWVKENNIPHSTQMSENGIFIVIYSKTEKIAEDNKFKLDELLHSF